MVEMREKVKQERRCCDFPAEPEGTARSESKSWRAKPTFRRRFLQPWTLFMAVSLVQERGHELLPDLDPQAAALGLT